MSAKPHKFWPSVGSVWSHWSDLLLATQLAALRAGFNYVGRYWAPSRPIHMWVRCTVETTAVRTANCRHSLLSATAVDPKDPSGAWKVVGQDAGNLEAERHPKHTYPIGLSSWLKEEPTGCTTLQAGDTVTGFRELHNLEGSLRSDARRDGRFLARCKLRETKDTRHDFAFTCVLDTARCAFFVMFTRLLDTSDGQPQWRCVEIRSAHTCVSEALPPQERLKWRLKFFPPLQLEDGCTGRRTRTRKPASTGHLSQAAQHTGAVPVRERTIDDMHISTKSTLSRAGSSPRLVSLAATAAGSSDSNEPDPLAHDRTALSTAERELADATGSVKKLEVDLAAAEKLVEMRRKRVDKKRKKLQRKVERAQRKKSKFKEGRRSPGKKRDPGRVDEGEQEAKPRGRRKRSC